MVQLVEADLDAISGKVLFVAKLATSALMMLYITYYFVTTYSEMLSRFSTTRRWSTCSHSY